MGWGDCKSSGFTSKDAAAPVLSELKVSAGRLDWEKAFELDNTITITKIAVFRFHLVAIRYDPQFELTDPTLSC
jgi:hypothetical protein